MVSWCLYLSDNLSVVLSKSNIAGSGNNGFFFFVSGELYWSNQPNLGQSKIKLSLAITSCRQTTEAVRSTGGISPCRGPTQHEQRLQLAKARVSHATFLPSWAEAQQGDPAAFSVGAVAQWEAEGLWTQMSLLVLDFLGQAAGFGLWDLTWTLPPASCFWLGRWKWVHEETQLPLPSSH